MRCFLVFNETDLAKIRADRLKEILNNSGLTQKEFVKRVQYYSGSGFHEVTLSKIKNGHEKLSEKTAEDIIKAFPEYNLSWLLGYTSSKTGDEYYDNVTHYTLDNIRNIWNVLFFASTQLKQLGEDTAPFDELYNSTKNVKGFNDLSYKKYDSDKDDYYQLLRLTDDINDYAKMIVKRYIDKVNHDYIGYSYYMSSGCIPLVKPDSEIASDKSIDTMELSKQESQKMADYCNKKHGYDDNTD